MANEYLDKTGLTHFWDNIKGEIGNASDAQVDDWLDRHPEATTTVQDGAITTAKLANGAVDTAKLADGSVTDAKLAQSGGILDTVIDLRSASETTDASLSSELFQFESVSPNSSMNGYRLNKSDGYISANNDYKINRYALNGAIFIKINSVDRFQFQNTNTINSSGTNYRIGITYSSGAYIVPTPSGATWLIVSTPISNESTVEVVKKTVLSEQNFHLLVDEAIEDNISKTNASNMEFTPILIPKEGGYYDTSGVWRVSASMMSYGPIPVMPKQVLYISTEAPSVTRALFVCDEKGNYIESVRIGSNSVITDHILNDTDKIKYYYTSTLAATNQKIKISNKYLLNGKHVNKIKDLDLLSKKINSSGVISSINIRYADQYTTNDYCMTTPMFLKAGTKISVRGTIESNTPVIIETNELGSTYNVSVLGIGGLNVYEYLAKSDCYICVQYMPVATYYTKLYIQYNWNDDYVIDYRRKAVVSFSFDDMHADDDQFYELFRKHNLTCGFALIATLSMDQNDTERYLDWQSEGFSMLSHSIDGNTMGNSDLTTEEAKQKFITSKQRLSQRGYKPIGWVTPSSNLGSNFMADVKNIYSYAYTSYYGAYPDSSNNGRPPYTTIDTDPCELYRVHLSSLLENLESALDSCIANHGWMNLYLHAFEITDSIIERLDSFLTYIETKISNYELRCLPPDKAYMYFYQIRHNDIPTNP